MPRYGLIGERLSHSYSKEIHEALGGYGYELMPMNAQQVADLLTSRDFDGINVTIPYKKLVIPYLDELSDRARAVGAVNTVVRRSDGSLYGDNTDYSGFLFAAHLAGIELNGKAVTVLGSGGTSLTVQAAALGSGASSVTVVSRGGKVDYSHPELFSDAQILVNTTPVGMYPDCLPPLVSPGSFSRLEGVIDVIYNPRVTGLLLEAARCGIRYSGGLPMLVKQAADACRLFTGREISDSEVVRVVNKITRDRDNIILVGMPGCGKTTIGRLLARRLGRRFTDTDELVCEREGRSVSAIFAESGEAVFRAVEAQAVADITKESGLVIATGGGAVLRVESRDAMRRNGRVVYISRDTSRLGRRGRPLSKSYHALEQMQRQREPIYSSCCDVRVENSGTREETVNKILEALGYEDTCH